MTLPSQEILKKVSGKIKKIPNRQGEYKRKIHYCCYLLCSQSGLRISESVKFDLSTKTKKGLYRINKPKGKKERFVYISSSVISELKTNNWQPDQTNRHNFYHFLKKVKRELNISKEIELSPHTLRRTFTTYHANSGVPLPLLQKLLGHSSIRTTALYWHDTDEDGNHDIPDILQVKKWLERPKSSQRRKTQKLPTIENFAPPKVHTFHRQLPANSEPVIIPQKPVIPSQKTTISTNSPPPISIEPKPKITNHELELKTEQKEILATSEQLPEKSTTQELILLAKIKSLEEQLKKAQELAQQEKNRADKAEQLLKQMKLEENQAQIIQPSPWKFK